MNKTMYERERVQGKNDFSRKCALWLTELSGGGEIIQ